MTQMGRSGMSSGKKQEVWHRWRNGESLSEIGRAVGKHPRSIFRVLKLHGGISQAPRQRGCIKRYFQYCPLANYGFLKKQRAAIFLYFFENIFPDSFLLITCYNFQFSIDHLWEIQSISVDLFHIMDNGEQVPLGVHFLLSSV